MTKADIRKLARRIAKDVMTANLGTRDAIQADRIALMKPHRNLHISAEMNLGGRCRESVEVTVADAITKFFNRKG